MDDWLNYLYIMGAITNEDRIGDSRLKDLVFKYNSMFPENPLYEDFFFDNTQEEQIRRLSEAINNYEPINGLTR